jgi:hypothetical protein
LAEGTGLFQFSDIYVLDNVAKHVGIQHGKALLVDSLREIFARDKEYHYVRDMFGFPKTPSHLNLEENAGVDDDATTRIHIGTYYRYEQSYLPAVSVRQTSIQYKPISFNQNRQNIQYERRKTEDGYGNIDFIRVPAKYVVAGAWDQNFEIKVVSNSQEDTAAIADIIMISLQSTYRDVLQRNGLFIKQISAGGEQAESVNANDPIYSISISASTYSEWRREIPVSNLVERIHICFNFDLGSQDDPPASGMSLNYIVE